MASLLGWLGNAVKRVENTVNNDVVQPINRDLVRPTIQSVQNAGDVLNAGRQGVGGLINIAAANATHNALARQNAIRNTQNALNYSLNASRGLYTPQEASSPNLNTAVLKPVLRGVATYAPLAIGPEVAGLAGPEASALAKLGIAAGTGGAIGSGSTALGQVSNGQKLNIKDIAKAGVAGAGLGLAGEGIGLVKSNKIPLNEVGSVGKSPEYKYKIENGNGTTKFNKLDNTNSFQDVNGVSHPIGSNAKIAVKNLDGTGETRVFTVNNISDQKNFNNQLLKYGGRGNIGSVSIDESPALVKSPALPSKPVSNSPAPKLTPDSIPTKVAGKGSANLNKDAFSAKDIATLNKQIAVEQAKSDAKLRAAPTTPLSARAERQLRVKPEANPMTPGPLDKTVKLPPPVDAGNSAQAFLNADFVANKIKGVGAKAETAVKQLSPKDQALMQKLQTKGIDKIAAKAENPAQLRAAEQALRTYYDTRIAYDHANGIPTPYRKNYLRDLVPQTEQGAKFPATGGSKAPGYVLPKENPGKTGVLEGLQRDIAGSSFNHGKLTYAKGLEEAFPNQVSRGQPVVGEAGVTQQLRTPYGNELFATKDVAKGINKREIAPKAEGALAKYDSANAFLKYAKLSGGAFHAFTEGGNFIGQQIMNGKLFTEPGSTGKMFKVAFSDKALRTEVKNLADNGTLDKAQLGGLTWTPSEIKADVSVTPKGNVAKYTGLKALHDATFQREIPYAKLKSFEQATKGLDPGNPADLANIRSAAKAINRGYGGINRTVEGLTPRQAKIAARGLLATDFTEGKIRTILAAIGKGGQEGKIARQIVAGKVLLFAGLATAGGTLAGEYQGKSPTQIAENILGNFINPTFKAGANVVSFPATHISEFGKPLTPLLKNPRDRFGGIGDYAKNRFAAIPSELLQLKDNMDYSGNHIYGKETKKAGGAPIPPTKTALNVASGVLPIPVSQAINTGQGKQSTVSAVANIAGLKVRPDQAQTPAGQKAQTTAQTTQEVNQLKAKPPEGYDLRDVGNGKFAYTVNGEVKTTGNLQTAQRAIAKDSLENSSQSIRVIGDQVYRKKADGTVGAPISKTKYDYQLGASTLTAQKNSGDVSGYIKTAQSQLDSIAKQLKDPSIDPLDAQTLQNQASTLQSNIAKYKTYGGFTKPKTGSRSRGGSGVATTSFKTAKTASAIKRPTGVKVSTPKYTAPKAKISVSKIPKLSVKIKKKAK